MRVAIPLDGPSLLERYRDVAGDAPVRALEAAAKRLRGHRIAMVNSTATGGGVAEILHRLVRLLVEAGVPTTWEVMPGGPEFYAYTKAMHNELHGLPARFDAAGEQHYRDTNARAAATLELPGDLVLIHDPQPAALIEHRRQPGQRWLWRCHIDLSHALPRTWARLQPWVEQFDGLIYSHPAFVHDSRAPAYLAPPSIDPLSDKNCPLEPSEIEEMLEPFALPADRPLITQVSRFDRLKDPLGVLEAFVLARRRIEAHLVLAGGTADDDPEGDAVLAEVRERAAGREDVTILALPPDAHRVINALQRRSRIIVQKSLREGFALTVSEGLWKRRAVIASAVGGIPLQVLHGRTGLLVRSVEGCAQRMVELVDTPALARRLGAEGHEHVRQHFLHTREARDYLVCFLVLDRLAAAR